MSDLISRQAAIDAVKHAWAKGLDPSQYIEELPSAQPEHGRWEEREVIDEIDSSTAIDQWQSARCSACGKYHTTPYLYYFTDYEYCPWCGAYMKGEQDEQTD